MTYTYKTKGVCSRSITIELEDGIIRSCEFEGGCNGNTQGICALVENMKATEAIDRLEGITCGYKSTSCPDQLAKALTEMLENEEQQ